MELNKYFYVPYRKTEDYARERIELAEDQEFENIKKLFWDVRTWYNYLLWQKTNIKTLKDNKISFYFVTINPKPDIPFDQFKNACDKYFGKRKYIYTYEQRGKTIDEVGKGYHLHFIHPKKSYDINHIRKELLRIFGEYVGNSKHIDIRGCPESYLQDKILYMKGHKWDEGKKSAVDINIEFRKKYFLDSIYNAPEN